MPRRVEHQETLVFLDAPAAAAIAAAARFLEARGLSLTHRTPYSVAFTERGGPADGAPEAGGSTPAGAGAAGEGLLRPGAGQIAAVPVQLRPDWCRVWVTVNGEGAAAAAAVAYVHQQRERSRRVQAAVRRLERDLYHEAQWPAYEATLRASLQRHGTDTAEVDAKVAAFKQRWLALGRRAAGAPAEEPPA